MNYLPEALRRLKKAAQMDPPDDFQRGLGMMRKVDVRDLQALIYHFEELEAADRARYYESVTKTGNERGIKRL